MEIFNEEKLKCKETSRQLRQKNDLTIKLTVRHLESFEVFTWEKLFFRDTVLVSGSVNNIRNLTQDSERFRTVPLQFCYRT